MYLVVYMKNHPRAMVDKILNAFELISWSVPMTKIPMSRILCGYKNGTDDLENDIKLAVRQDKLPKEDVLLLALWTAVVSDRADVVSKLLEMGVDALRYFDGQNAITICFPNAKLKTEEVSLNALKTFLEYGIDVSNIITQVTRLTNDIDAYQAFIKWQIDFGGLRDQLKDKDTQSYPFSRKDLSGAEYFILQLEALGYLVAGTESNRGEKTLVFLIQENAIRAARFLISRMDTIGEARFDEAYASAILSKESDALELLLNAGVSFESKGFDPLQYALQHGCIAKFRLILNAGYDLSKTFKDKGQDTTIEQLAKASGKSEFIVAINIRKKKDAEERSKRDLAAKNAAADAANPSMDSSSQAPQSSSSTTSSLQVKSVKPVVTSEPVVRDPTPPALPSEDVQRLLITISTNSIVVMPPDGIGRMAYFDGKFINPNYVARISSGELSFSKLLRILANQCETNEAMELNK